MAKNKKNADATCPNDLSATASVIVKLVGRYMVATPCDPQRTPEVRIFAPRLEYPTIHLLTHFVSLTIDSRYVKSGMETAVRAIPAWDGTGLRELVVWDLGGYDVEFMGYIQLPLCVSLPDQTDTTARSVVPDLMRLVPGGNCAIDPELLQYNMPATKPVSTRVNLVGGNLGCDFEGFGAPDLKSQQRQKKVETKLPETYTFGAVNDHSVNVGGSIGVPLADTMTWSTAIASETFAIRLRRFDGSGAHIIYCAPLVPTSDHPNAPKYPILPLFISNTCAAGVQINRDHEFAAYYDQLSAPTNWADRLVPVRSGGVPGRGGEVRADNRSMECDGTDLCSGFAQIAI